MNFIKNFRLFLIVPILILNFGFTYTQKEAMIDFYIIGKPGNFKIHGLSKALQSTLSFDKNKLSGQFLVKIDSFDTGIGTRNRHIKERYLEIEKYPDAKLSLEKMTIKDGKSKAPFKGKLTLHGVESPINGDVVLNKSEKLLNFKATFEFKISDYKITKPYFAGVTIDDVVQIEAEGSVQR